MHDAFGVRRLQRVGNLDGQRQQSFHLQRTSPDPLPQRHAIQKLHGDEGSSFVLADLVNRADVGMIQRRRRPRFAPEALQRQRFPRRIFGKNFSATRRPREVSSAL